MSIRKVQKQIQPRWPLTVDKSVGPYTAIFSAAESLKQDFIILLKTIPGEWPMNPDLGVGLEKYVFETVNSSELSDVKTAIQSQLRKYLPNIKLLKAEFESTDEQMDNYVSILKIEYLIQDLNLQDEIIIGVSVVELVNEYFESFRKLYNIDTILGPNVGSQFFHALNILS